MDSHQGFEGLSYRLRIGQRYGDTVDVLGVAITYLFVAGFELFTDLVFADFLVTYTPYASSVVFQYVRVIPTR